MIKRILCFSNPAYLKLKLNQIVIEIPEVVYGKGVPDNMRQEGGGKQCPSKMWGIHNSLPLLISVKDVVNLLQSY